MPAIVLEIDSTQVEKAIKDSISNIAYNQYACIEVGTNTVCEIWGVCYKTVTNKIKSGLLIPINPGSSKYKFRLSDVLRDNPRFKQSITSTPQ